MAKLYLAVMSAAYLIFGLSMILQARRWASTPAYHVLLAILRAPQWGALFTASGTLLDLAAWQYGRRRWVVITALIPAFGLTTGWGLSFVARYLTSAHTTPETWVSWAVFDLLLLQAAVTLDHPRPPAGDDALAAITAARRALQLAEEAYERSSGRPAEPG